MRIKKSIPLKKKRSAPIKKPASELDPTINYGLHMRIWEKLIAKISVQRQM